MMELLVVEDDKNLRRFLRNALREEGYAVDEAESGDRALARALERGYSCIVLDVMLPQRDGFSVVEELRKRRVLTPVLMLTARDELDSKLKGLEGGADDYLTKPFDLAEFLARVRALIRRADFRHEDAVLRVGDIALDRLSRCVTRGAHTIDLSPREFDLLEFLMRNAGHTVSRSRISEAVWRYQFDTETNVVDVYVNYLRKKLTREGVKPPIKTVRGIGYRLEIE
jgi:DNA-binding response OmpR family regulator